MSTQHHQILIIGGGNAGISAAAQLLRKNQALDIAIIEPSENHYYQPAWTLVGGGVFDIKKTEHKEADVIPKGAKWIKDACASFQPEQNAVTLASGEQITYDYLIVCPGIQLDWDKVKGLKENLGTKGITSNYSFKTAPYTYECLRNFKGGKALFTSPNTPVKCGGAPQKIMYLAGDYIGKHGLKDKSEVHFYTGGTIIFGVKKYADTLNKVVERYGIQTHFKHNLVELNADAHEAVFETEVDGQIQRVVDHYEFIHVTPPQSAPDFIKNSPLGVPSNPLGWIDVNKNNFQHVRYPNIFGVGDATNTPNAKTGAAVRKQIPVLVHNLITLIETGQLGTESYTGYGSCPLITGYGKLVLAEFDYTNTPTETFPFDQSKERYSMWLMKKELLPWLYWHEILPGRM